MARLPNETATLYPACHSLITRAALLIGWPAGHNRNTVLRASPADGQAGQATAPWEYQRSPDAGLGGWP